MRFLHIVIPLCMLTNTLQGGDKDLQPCVVYGNIFITTNINHADVIVYKEDAEFLSDVRVFFEENRLMADQPGIWHQVKQESFADFIVYFSDTIDEADFSISIVDNILYAGCKED